MNSRSYWRTREVRCIYNLRMVYHLSCRSLQCRVESSSSSSLPMCLIPALPNPCPFFAQLTLCFPLSSFDRAADMSVLLTLDGASKCAFRDLRDDDETSGLLESAIVVQPSITHIHLLSTSWLLQVSEVMLRSDGKGFGNGPFRILDFSGKAEAQEKRKERGNSGETCSSQPLERTCPTSRQETRR